MDADRIIDALETLRAAELRRVAARVRELTELYDSWQTEGSVAAPAAPDGPGVSYRHEYVRCGKVGCRKCAGGGQGHGPYWYAYWFECGRTRSKYIGKELPRASEGEGAAAAAVVEQLAGVDQLDLVAAAPVAPVRQRKRRERA